MEFQIVREGAEQFDEHEHGQDIDDQFPIDAVNDPHRKFMDLGAAIQGLPRRDEIEQQSRHGAHQREQHDDDQDGNDDIEDPAIGNQRLLHEGSLNGFRRRAIAV